MGILLTVAAVAIISGFQLGRSYERDHPKKKGEPRKLSASALFGIKK